MTVNYTHPEYDKWLGRWTKVRDHLAGAETVKERGTTYLPFLGDEDDADDRKAYERYKFRATYLEATARTHQALAGAITWKEPNIQELSDALKDGLGDVTMEGHSFSMLVSNVIEEVVAVSRCGLLVDMPRNEAGVINTGEFPYFVLYETEDIINWRHERINDQMVLTLLVVKETYWEENEDDEYTPEERLRYRVLRLRDGIYSQQVIEEISEGQLEEGEEIVPRFRGQAMDRIPFIFCTTEGNVCKIPKLLLSGVVELNISHYITCADLEHGRHFTALPQPWVAGFDMDSELRIGSGVAWVTNDPQARAGYLEFSGQGLQSLERAIDQKEQQMAMLGAKLLEGQRPGVIAAETARINQAGESSTLSQVANNIEASVTEALRIWVEMQGGSDVPFVELNKDFVDQRLDPQSLQALMAAYIGGGISYETLFFNLTKGEVIAPGTTLDDEKELIRMREEEQIDLDQQRFEATNPNFDPAQNSANGDL